MLQSEGAHPRFIQIIKQLIPYVIDSAAIAANSRFLVRCGTLPLQDLLLCCVLLER